MKRILFITGIIVISILNFNSCRTINEEVKTALIGEYLIDSIKYDGTNLLTRLSINQLALNESVVELPKVFDEMGQTADAVKKGKWSYSISAKGVKVTINSDNKYFNGIYDVRFEKNEAKKDFIVYLMSEKMKMKCIKDWFNYAENSSLVNQMVKLTEKKQ